MTTGSRALARAEAEAPDERTDPEASLRRARVAWIAGAGGALALGIVLFATGISPWLAPAAVLLCLTLAIGQRTSWPFAFAAGVIVQLALVALILRFTPSWNLSLTGGSALMFALLGLGGLLAFGFVREPRLLGARTLRVGLPVLAVPVLLMSLVAFLTLSSGNLEWAMRNDAVWNLVMTRTMVEDGGLDAISHPNAAPLTPGLLAIAIAVGRHAVEGGDLLAHDVSRVATFWLAATLAAALLAALIGARSVHGGTRTARIVAAALASLVPVSWYTFGFAAQYGFYNATLALVLLLASWLAWLEARVSPVAAAAVLSLASVALLATWAPLALIPFALALFALISRMSILVRSKSRGWAWIVLVLAALPVPLYGLVVTLPDLRRDGAALAVDGGFIGLQASHVMVVVAVAVGVAVLNAIQRNQVHPMNGLLITCGAGALAGGYLLAQRLGLDSLWGYYPAKFAWILMSLVLVILTASLAGEMAGLRGRPWAATGVAAVALVVPLSLMMLLPSPHGRLAPLLTPVAIASNTGVAGGEPAARRLFDLAEPGRPTLALSYLGPAGDSFLNSWLLQLEATSGADPIRVFAYTLDPQNEEQACEAVHAWDRPVRVVTSDPAVAERFTELCADADVTVDVLEP
ncbi:hypothetical protein ASD56_14415 [Microbacterium sp. Root166]|uniref:hypothetical protein n=1 Tax=Microbacterium sp. Root166 TaxID=1736478 RepID=UPI0006F6A660|nr:hypothetical protein [Microbacterium sp. Root166]KQZ82080.1 hypothetical protein ASD56_14415 [Microbacterium sp. Root166]